MVAELLGRLDWGLSTTTEGHRNYDIEWLVKTADVNDGPGIAAFAPGLPAIGATWQFGNESDLWAFCKPDWKIQRAFVKNEPDLFWKISQTYSTEPRKRCQDAKIENPLAEPARVSGGYAKFTKPSTRGRDGKLWVTSSQELITGPATEWDNNRPTVKVGLNTLLLPLETFGPKVDDVNDAVMWGLSARKIKLSNVTWQRQIYGLCNFYFSLEYEFEIDAKGFDRVVADKGKFCLQGYMLNSKRRKADGSLDPIDPDGLDLKGSAESNYLNPANYERYKDSTGEPAECFLDGKGRPVTREADAARITLEKYDESNLLELGVPVGLNFAV